MENIIEKIENDKQNDIINTFIECLKSIMHPIEFHTNDMKIYKFTEKDYVPEGAKIAISVNLAYGIIPNWNLIFIALFENEFLLSNVIKSFKYILSEKNLNNIHDETISTYKANGSIDIDFIIEDCYFDFYLECKEI